jgi:hypothetical protein
MKLVKRKTRKALRKSVNKVIKKHGGKIAAGLAGGIASTLATLASTDAPGTMGTKSNLGRLSEKVADSLTPKKLKKAAKRHLSDESIDKENHKKALRPSHQEPPL